MQKNLARTGVRRGLGLGLKQDEVMNIIIIVIITGQGLELVWMQNGWHINPVKFSEESQKMDRDKVRVT